MTILGTQQAIERARDAELAARGLPEVVYIKARPEHCTDAPVIGIRRGEMGFYPIWTQANVDDLNLGYSKSQIEAMVMGSIFGWECPASFPEKWE